MVDTLCIADFETHVRRTHYALAFFFVVAASIMQLLMVMNTFHLAFVLLSSSGFTFAVAGLLVGIMVLATERGILTIGARSARLIVWTNVVALVFTLINILHISSLLTHKGEEKKLLAPPAAADGMPTQPPVCLITHDSVELHVIVYLNSEEFFELVLLGLWFLLLALLHAVTIFLYTRIIIRYDRIYGCSVPCEVIPVEPCAPYNESTPVGKPAVTASNHGLTATNSVGGSAPPPRGFISPSSMATPVYRPNTLSQGPAPSRSATNPSLGKSSHLTSHFSGDTTRMWRPGQPRLTPPLGGNTPFSNNGHTRGPVDRR